MNKYPDNYDLIDPWFKKKYDWKFGKSIGTDTVGNEWFVVEGDSDRDNFYWYLVSVSPVGDVSQYRERAVPKETYVTEKAIAAMGELQDYFMDYFNN